MTWSRLIRFLDEDGKVHLGDPVVADSEELFSRLAENSLEAERLHGETIFELSKTGDKLHVKELVPLLRSDDVPLVRCIGLNYKKHIEEGGRTPPPFPSLFIKPSTSIAGFAEDIPIPKLAQNDQLDYEGELAIVIGKSGKNIPKEHALDYVAGYVASNDVSARTWQRDPKFAGSVPQWCFSKGFDKFAPLGPLLVSPKVLGAADNLTLQTFVNGEERQNANTSDLLFGVEDIVSFLSQGTTLEKGTVIMTGTPAGVIMGMKTPQWLQDGDVVEVRIQGLGSVKNKMKFI